MELGQTSTVKAFDAIFGKGIPRGLGLRLRDSLYERLGNWMVNESVKIRTAQALSLQQ